MKGSSESFDVTVVDDNGPRLCGQILTSSRAVRQQLGVQSGSTESSVGTGFSDRGTSHPGLSPATLPDLPIVEARPESTLKEQVVGTWTTGTGDALRITAARYVDVDAAVIAQLEIEEGVIDSCFEAVELFDSHARAARCVASPALMIQPPDSGPVVDFATLRLGETVADY